MLALTLKIFRNLRMKYQIATFNFCIMLIALASVTIISRIQMSIFDELVSTSSTVMLEIVETKNMNSITNQVYNYISYKHQQDIIILFALRQYLDYFKTNLNSQIKTNLQDPCVPNNISLSYSYLNFTPKFCYLIQGISDKTTIPNNNSNITLLYYAYSYLTEFTTVIDITLKNYIQIADTSEYKYYDVFPKGQYTPGYDAQTRSWYIEHFTQQNENPNQQYFYSQPFEAFSTHLSYQFSITQSIYNNDEQLFGVQKINVNINDQTYQNINLNVMLVNNNGSVIYNGLINQQKLNNSFYVYDTNITGFNKTDWEFIIYQAKIAINDKDSIFKLYNKYYKQYVKVQSLYLSSQKFILITYSNVTALEDLKQQLYDYQEDISFLFTLSPVVFIGLFFFSLTISFIFIDRICEPITQLAQKIQNHTILLGNNTNENLFKMMMPKQKIKFDLVEEFNYKFMNFQHMLTESSNRKCQECITFEKMRYNKSDGIQDCSNLKIYTKSIKNLEQIQMTRQQIIYFLNKSCQYQQQCKFNN